MRSSGTGPQTWPVTVPAVNRSLRANGMVAISEAAPSTLTALPLAGGTTTCTVRGSMTWCTTSAWPTFNVPVVLARLGLMVLRLVCMTLDRQVVLPRVKLTYVVPNVAIIMPELTS